MGDQENLNKLSQFTEGNSNRILNNTNTQRLKVYSHLVLKVLEMNLDLLLNCIHIANTTPDTKCKHTLHCNNFENMQISKACR